MVLRFDGDIDYSQGDKAPAPGSLLRVMNEPGGNGASCLRNQRLAKMIDVSLRCHWFFNFYSGPFNSLKKSRCPKYTQISTIDMYKFMKISHTTLIQYLGSLYEAENIQLYSKKFFTKRIWVS